MTGLSGETSVFELLMMLKGPCSSHCAELTNETAEGNAGTKRRSRSLPFAEMSSRKLPVPRLFVKLASSRVNFARSKPSMPVVVWRIRQAYGTVASKFAASSDAPPEVTECSSIVNRLDDVELIDR